MMMKLSLALAFVATVSAECTYNFCPGGITYPNAVINPNDPVEQQATCTVIPFAIATGQFPDEQCPSLPALEYVCCPPPGGLPCGDSIVDFCPNGMSDPNLIINPEEPVEDQAPCSYVLAGLFIGMVPAEECYTIALAESICCPAPTEDPNASPTEPPTDTSTGEMTEEVTEEITEEITEEGGSCLFCGSDVPFNKEKTWGGEDICAQLDEELSPFPAGEFCDTFLADLFAEEEINLQSFCECEGAVAPNLCKVCPDGFEIDAAKAVPGADGLTCGAGADYVKHLANATKCSEYVSSEVIAVCCVAKQTTMPSSATSLAFSGLAYALILALAFGM